MSETNPYASKSAAVEVEPKAVEEETPQAEEVPSGTVSEMLAWVGDDKERAEAALKAEKDSAHTRVTLVSALEDILDK